jgi:quinol monooxygenase YgiN
MMIRYGLFGSLRAHPGKRDELLTIVSEGAQFVAEAPGCEVYIINVSPDDDEKIWFYESWRSEQDHDNSLHDSRIRDVIDRALPLIAGMEDRVILQPLVGKGLPD